MSRAIEVEPLVCEFCGRYIEDEDAPCPARDGEVFSMRATVGHSRVSITGVDHSEDAFGRHLFVCEFCGCEIEHSRKRCSALEDGRYQP